MTFRKHWPLHLLLAAFALLSVRAAWSLTVSELGWRPHLDPWIDTAAGFIGNERPTLAEKAPVEQAKFWLSEVERVESATQDPAVAMGAAWMLDTPQLAFIQHHVRVTEDANTAGLPPDATRELDYDAISELTAEYESLCRYECLARVESAIRLEPDNVALRRALALLLFQIHYPGLDSEPRKDDWLEVLDECARTDPDNALYDYLAALQLWTASADYDWDEDGWILSVHHQDKFQQGNDRLNAGLAKPYLKFGTDGFTHTLAFLADSSIPRSDHVDTAGSRMIIPRATNLLYGFLRWQGVQADVAEQVGRHESAIAELRKLLRIADQISEDGNYADLATVKWTLRQFSLSSLADMHGSHPGSLDAREGERIQMELAESEMETKILAEVSIQLGVKTETNSDVRFAGTTWHAWQIGLLTLAAQILVTITVAIALTTWVASRLFGTTDGENPAPMGWPRHIAGWILGFGISFVLLGMFPAEIVSPSVQTWLVTGLLWIGYAAVLVGVICFIHRRFHLPWSQLAALTILAASPMIFLIYYYYIVDVVLIGISTIPPIITLLICLQLAFVSWLFIYRPLLAFARNDTLVPSHKILTVAVFYLFFLFAVPAGAFLADLTSSFEPRAWIPPTVWHEAEQVHMGAEELQTGLNLETSKWAWAMIQWQAHHGAVIAPIVAIVVLLIWQLIRRSQRMEGRWWQSIRIQKRRQIRLSGQLVARSSAVAALVFSPFYLAIIPVLASAMDAQDRTLYVRLLDPMSLKTEIAETTDHIRSDAKLMERLQAEIDERNRQLAEQEARREE